MAYFHPCIFFFIIIKLANITVAQNNGRVNLSQSLTAGEKISSWVSPSGDFAFGFQQFLDKEDMFLLGIWFDKVPEKTMVWYADKNNPVPKGSKLTLTADGGLLLDDPLGLQQLWNTDPIVGQIDFAVMKDTGNLVLQNRNSEIIWESFKHPADTLLPTQTMEIGDVISSRQSGTNFSQGRFQLRVLPIGNLVLNSINLPSEYSNENYYESGTNNISNPGMRLVFNESGNLYIVRQHGQLVTLTEGNSVPNKDYYYRATLNFDGVFTLYNHSKNTSSGSWNAIWSVPDNICTASLVFKSSGACGFNRICRLNADRRPVCECPRGFTLLDSNDEYRGCKPDFIQDCQLDTESKVSPEELYVFQEITGVDWPTSDYEALQPYDEDKCKDSCLHDCMCGVAIMRNDTCWKKKLPLSNGKVDSSVGAKAYIKIRKANEVPDQDSGSSSQTKNQDALIIGGSVLLGFSVLINFLLLGAMAMGFFFVYRKRSSNTRQDKDVSRFNLRYFSYKDLDDATGGFEEELGRGSFGIVYKGLLKDTNEPVAVKKLDRTFRDSEKEFKAEVNVIGHIHHKNLVRLVGYCDEGVQRLLVYEYMSNGTLADLLFGDMRPSWHQRTQIAFGVAKGLLYLHEECSTQIIHCDIKPHNILLDDSYNARISDFGLAKLLMMEQSHTNTAIRGTKGYVAPEWFRNMPITVKVDVYSFGELLLEIICCRRSVDLEMGSEEKAILAYWAHDCYRAGALDALIGNDKEALNDMKNLERFLMVAFWCILEDPNLRPTMKKVVLMLEGIVQVPVPPNPFLFGSM